MKRSVSHEECNALRKESDIKTEKWRSKIEKALFGEDGRSGMVKDISDIKYHVENGKQKGRDWKQLMITVGGGIIVALVTYGIAKFA